MAGGVDRGQRGRRRHDAAAAAVLPARRPQRRRHPVLASHHSPAAARRPARGRRRPAGPGNDRWTSSGCSATPDAGSPRRSGCGRPSSGTGRGGTRRRGARPPRHVRVGDVGRAAWTARPCGTSSPTPTSSWAPATLESFGIAALEAAPTAGLPVLALYRHRGGRLRRHGREGFLATDRADGLTDVLARLARQPELRWRSPRTTGRPCPGASGGGLVLAEVDACYRQAAALTGRPLPEPAVPGPRPAQPIRPRRALPPRSRERACPARTAAPLRRPDPGPTPRASSTAAVPVAHPDPVGGEHHDGQRPADREGRQRHGRRGVRADALQARGEQRRLQREGGAHTEAERPPPALDVVPDLRPEPAQRLARRLGVRLHPVGQEPLGGGVECPARRPRRRDPTTRPPRRRGRRPDTPPPTAAATTRTPPGRPASSSAPRPTTGSRSRPSTLQVLDTTVAVTTERWS